MDFKGIKIDMTDPNQKLTLRDVKTGAEREVTVGAIKYNVAKVLRELPELEGLPIYDNHMDWYYKGDW